MIDQKRLMTLIDYDPKTGDFVWLKSVNSRAQIGYLAGGMRNGYRVIRIDNRRYQAHWLAWLYTHGIFPPEQLDHVNGSKAAIALHGEFARLNPL